MLTNDLPRIETDRLILRPIESSDAAALFEYFSQDKVTEFTDIDTFEEVSDAEGLIGFINDKVASSEGLRWAITFKAIDDDKLIGTCGLQNFSEENNRAEVGYDVNPAYWGQGVATEAIKAMIDHGFNILKLRRIEAFVVPANPASKKVLEKNGFEKEGTLRDYFFDKGKFIDVEILSILNKDN